MEKEIDALPNSEIIMNKKYGKLISDSKIYIMAVIKRSIGESYDECVIKSQEIYNCDETRNFIKNICDKKGYKFEERWFFGTTYKITFI